MSYVTLFSQERGIAVEPIDWWRETDIGADLQGDADGERAFEHDFGALAEQTDRFDTFEALNSRERALAFLRIENGRARYGVGDGIAWHRRQAWFHFRATRAIEQHRAHRVAAFVGFAHRAELEAYLVATGVFPVSPVHVPTAVPDARVPPRIVSFWRSALVRMRDTRPSLPPPAQRALDRKLRAWELATEREGTCCADERVLRDDPASP
jgi:hypothetical protein